MIWLRKTKWKKTACKFNGLYSTSSPGLVSGLLQGNTLCAQPNYFKVIYPIPLLHLALAAFTVSVGLNLKVSFIFNSLRQSDVCISKLTIIGAVNGLLPDWHQAIIWTNDGIYCLLKPQEKNFSKICNKIHTFSFKKMHFKMSSGKWQPFCCSFM